MSDLLRLMQRLASLASDRGALQPSEVVIRSVIQLTRGAGVRSTFGASIYCGDWAVSNCRPVCQCATPRAVAAACSTARLARQSIGLGRWLGLFISISLLEYLFPIKHRFA
jgi:hypothetical protein